MPADDFAGRIMGSTIGIDAFAKAVEFFEENLLVGDVNCDGEINKLDVAPFVQLLVSGEYSAKADINGDGAVTLLDVQGFVALIIGG